MYLVDIVAWDGVVESTVEIVQQFNDLYRTTFRRQLCESDDIREVDRRARIICGATLSPAFSSSATKLHTVHTWYTFDLQSINSRKDGHF